jgi:hypothetical protein
MKWILIAAVLDWQPVYTDQKTCQLAAEELKKVYYQEVAACIPKPDGTAESDQMTDMFSKMLDMVKELQAIDPKVVDKSGN